MRIYLSIPLDSYLYLFNLLIYYIMCIEPDEVEVVRCLVFNLLIYYIMCIEP